jgi:hypothetical protein
MWLADDRASSSIKRPVLERLGEVTVGFKPELDADRPRVEGDRNVRHRREAATSLATRSENQYVKSSRPSGARQCRARDFGGNPLKINALLKRWINVLSA